MNQPAEASRFAIGQPVRRKEDLRLLTGKGRYSDDQVLPHQAYAAILRSPHAHAVIRGIDTTQALKVPGVIAVFTGADIRADGLKPILPDYAFLGPVEIQKQLPDVVLQNRDGSPMKKPVRKALADTRVRHVGDPVAFVVAQTATQAKDAAEAVELDIDPLPAVIDPRAAAAPGAPLLHDDAPGNVSIDYYFGETEKTAAAFARAAHVTRLRLDNNRVVVADVIVEKDGDEWKIHLNSDYIPRLRISSTYRDLIAKGSLSKAERDYVRERMRSGKFLIDSIEQRQRTIERITREILSAQREFFENGVSSLRPLTMTQVADVVGVHETTVSRAIANKYIRTPHGVFDFKYFFTPGYQSEGGAAVSNTSVKELIADLINIEDRSSPLSDEDIVRKLMGRGIKIARRTVAKYREELGLLPSNLRRDYK